MKYFLTFVFIIGMVLVFYPRTQADVIIQPESISIYGKTLNLAEYATLKTNIIAKIKNRTKVKPTYKESNQWVEILNRECKNIQLQNVTENNLIDKLNIYLENNCL